MGGTDRGRSSRPQTIKEHPISSPKLILATAIALVALGTPFAQAASAYPPGPTANVKADNAFPPGPTVAASMRSIIAV